MKFYEDPVYVKMCSRIPVPILVQMRDKGQSEYTFLVDTETARLQIVPLTHPITLEKEFIIWTQDQLQEMAFNPNFALIDLIHEFNYEVLDKYEDDNLEEHNDIVLKEYYSQFSSLEQIWLAVVMRIKFHQIWNPKIRIWI